MLLCGIDPNDETPTDRIIRDCAAERLAALVFVVVRAVNDRVSSDVNEHPCNGDWGFLLLPRRIKYILRAYFYPLLPHVELDHVDHGSAIGTLQCWIF